MSFIRWTLCFKRYKRTLSIFNFRKTTDFHTIASYMFIEQHKILVLKCYCSFTYLFILAFVDLLPFTLSLFLHFLVPVLAPPVHQIVLCGGLYFYLCLIGVYDTFPSPHCFALHYSFLQWLGFSSFSYTYFLVDLRQQPFLT